MHILSSYRHKARGRRSEVISSGAPISQIQSAWPYQQANFGGPSLWPGFGISPGAGPAPGFGYQQYMPPPGFYSQPAADWSFTSDHSAPALEA